VIDEPGTAESVAVWEAADRRLSSRLLYPEARAALGAAGRTGRLSRSGLAGARAELERLWAGVEGIEPTAEIAQRAGDLAEELALKGYDAVHLATAEAAVDPDGVLAASDGQLAAAAQALGIMIVRLG